MCCSVCHAPRRTRGTDASALAREGNQDLIVARLATDAGEAMGEDAAAQVLGEFALDMARQAAASASRTSASRVWAWRDTS
jgi:hypothetical protein